MTNQSSIPVLEAWRALLAATIDAVMVIDHAGRIELFNGAAETLFGYRADELLGKNVSVLMPDPDRSSHDRYMQSYMTTGEKHIIGIGREVLARRKDGTIFPVHLAIGEIAGDGPRRFVGQLHDITSRRRALDELQRERDMARRYLEIAQVALMVLDAENRIVMMNRKGCEILRRNESDVIGANWLALAVPPAEQAAVAAVFDTLRHQGGKNADEQYHEYQIVDSDGTLRLVAWRGVSMQAGITSNGTLLLSGDDITDKRLAEDSARRTTDRMNEVSRLASLGEMAGGIAHEINQPLTAITNYAQASYRMLSATSPDLVDIRDALQEISSQALRAGEIIRRLRNLIRKQETQQEYAAISSVIADVIGFISNDAKLNEVTLKLNCHTDLPLLLIDKVQIQQVLFNLLRNAVEAVMVNPPKERLVEIRCELDAEWVLVRVLDNGPGVAPEFMPRMFTPLQTTKSNGTGLGLATSHSIAEAHQGSLRYVPGVGSGACFELRLPIPDGLAE